MLKYLVATAVGLGLAASADAAIVINFAPGVSAPSAGFVVIDEFNDLSNVTVNAGSVITMAPPSNGNGAVPAFATHGSPDFLSVLGGGSATITFGPNVGAFQFDWGSIDAYNTLTIVSSSGMKIVIPGSTANFPTNANGNQHAIGSNGLFTVSGNNGERFKSITLTSNSNSFEIDNLAVSYVPEPATWAMLITGFGLVGVASRRRRSMAKVAA